MEQWCCQAWIERIPRHIQEIIRLEGGNEYREGAMEKTRRLKHPDDWVNIDNDWVDICGDEGAKDREERSPSPTLEVVSRKKKYKEHAGVEHLGGPDIFKIGRRSETVQNPTKVNTRIVRFISAENNLLATQTELLYNLPSIPHRT
jgi:hypothetical protein